jgi:hypothetical protein
MSWNGDYGVLRGNLPPRDCIDLYALRTVSLISEDTADSDACARELSYPDRSNEYVIAFLRNGVAVFPEYSGDCRYKNMFWFLLRAYFFNTFDGTGHVQFCHISARSQDMNGRYPCCYFKVNVPEPVFIRFTKYTHPVDRGSRHLSWTIFRVEDPDIFPRFIMGTGYNFLE